MVILTSGSPAPAPEGCSATGRNGAAGHCRDTGEELSPGSTQELFRGGNYATVAMRGSREDWRTFAALGLIGKTEEALAGLARASDPEAVFYSAVTSWIGGDGERAAALLETLSTAHARRLLALIRKPCVEVLAQLPSLAGGCADLLSGAAQDPAFPVRNLGFRPGDLPNEPYADIHRYCDPQSPPDFFICNMVEWHLIPPNLQELPCPVF